VLDHAALSSRPDQVVVSEELTVLLRAGAAAPGPAGALGLAFAFPADGPATLSFETAEDVGADDADVRLLLADTAFRRLGGVPDALVGRAYHLSSELRRVALALRDCGLAGEVGFHYRAAKAIELVCEVVRLLAADDLTPLAADAGLSLADSRRVFAARQLIEERWNEALTLEQIGRACGLNRAKLSRGFRSLFNRTVAEALAERRLSEASQLLRTTDLPVSLIAYRSGYQNNASFSRAFGRHFGVPPTSYRTCALAA
jgi:AraC family transcriptional activator of pyochelin receptor